MDDKHRESIKKNFLSLVNNVNIKALLPSLIQKGVFSPAQAEKYWCDNRLEKDVKRELFFDIQRRGPCAFDKLVVALEEIDFNHKTLAFKLMDKEIPQPEDKYNANLDEIDEYPSVDNEDVSTNMNSSNGVWAYKLPQDLRPNHIRQLSYEAPNTNIDLSCEPLIINVRKSTQFLDDRNMTKVPVYAMRSKNRGIFLCINNVEFINEVQDRRDGAEVDEEGLKKLFKDMGFVVQSHRNQTRKDMVKTIDSFVDAKCNPLLKKVDCVIVAVMSHGEEGDSKESSDILTSDGQHLSVSWILDQFSNLNCTALINKPKIFLFQMCRGDNLHLGVNLEKIRLRSDGIIRTSGKIVREREDILIGFATLPGDKSYRDTFNGTWYMEAICKIFMNHAYDTDIENLLKMVDDDLRQLKSDRKNMQTSCYENRGFKLCYLHPGLFLEETTPVK